MDVVPGQAAGGSAEHDGTRYWFCSPGCREKFVTAPAQYVAPAPVAVIRPPSGRGAADTRIYTCPMHPEVRQVGPGSCPKCGMALEPVEVSAGEEGPSAELVDMTRRFWVSLALTLPVFALAMAEMVTPDLAARLSPTARLWIQLVLSTPVVLWGGWPFFVRGWQSLVTRSLNMFTLIALGTGAAFAYSVFAVLFPDALPHGLRHGGLPPVYFEAAAVITTLVLLGQVLELRARSATSGAIRALLGLAPKTARRLRGDGGEEDVPLADVHAGRSAARASRRDGAGRRRGARGPERGRRVDGHRRADPGGEGPGGPGHRRHGERHRRLRHARRARGSRHAARADRPHGRRGPAQPRAHPAPGRRGRRLVRARGGAGGGRRRRSCGASRARAAPGLRPGQRRRGADHRLPLRAGAGHADVHHGGHRPRRAGRRADQERRGARDAARRWTRWWWTRPAR